MEDGGRRWRSHTGISIVIHMKYKGLMKYTGRNNLLSNLIARFEEQQIFRTYKTYLSSSIHVHKYLNPDLQNNVVLSFLERK